MTTTIAILINAILAAGIVTALAFVVRIPHRLPTRHAEPVVERPGERELARAA
jgi:hypothetical protein